MEPAAFIIGLFICCGFIKRTPGAKLEGVSEPRVQSECRDRYLWIHVTSSAKPQLEAVDANGVHPISEQLAPLCGYTISTFNTDGSTTLRASFYSCYTHNQNDQVFTFRLNVLVADAVGGLISTPVSAVCSGAQWTQREITCEEDYMEVNVDRVSSCGGPGGHSGQVWQTALSQAQRTASLDWQLMILKSDGQVSSMSISEAWGRGLSLTTTAHRIILRSLYKQPHSEQTAMDGVPVEVVRVFVFSKQKLAVIMIDVSMACTLNSGSFDGSQLLWDVPLIMPPLVGQGAGFESKSLGLGVDGVLLDESTLAARGIGIVQEGYLARIRVPFGAKGGYRKSLVLDNVYKEKFMILVLYEHVFSLLFEDGSSMDTRHRMVRVLDTPLLCRPPFSLDQTMDDDQMFRVYLGNIPANVVLQEVLVNGKQLTSESAERGYRVNPVINANGTLGYELQLPFEEPSVHRMYLGEGVLQYSADLNFTLSTVPLRESYHHFTALTAQVTNAYPPEITAQCSDGGITFSVLRPSRADSLWEVGINQEPLTSELAAQRGYRLYGDSHRTTLEVPIFSVGYTYEEINLSNFYGTFKLLLRDSKTLEVQTSTSKRCLFKTQDMIVCSADGIMTVVTTPTFTWPTVSPERTTLLDPTCGPKQTDRSRVLFEFSLGACGTRAKAGELYMVYENEILHNRQLIADGPNLISRESQFKVTVRCFYPLSGVSRLSVDRIFRPDTPGIGSVKVFRSIKDSEDKLPPHDHLLHVPGIVPNTPTNQVHQTPEVEGVQSCCGTRPKPVPSQFITVPAGQNRPLHSPQSHQNFPNLPMPGPQEGSITETHQAHLQVPSPGGSLLSLTEKKPVSNLPQRHGNAPHNRFQVSHLDAQSLERLNDAGLSADFQALGLSLSSRIPIPAGGGRFEGNCGSYKHSSGLNRFSIVRQGMAPGYQSQRHDSSQATQVHEAPGQSSRKEPGSSDILLPSIPVSHLSPSQLNQTPQRPGSLQRQIIEAGQPGVQKVRIKPMSKIISAGSILHKKPAIQLANPEIPQTNHYATSQNAEIHQNSKQQEPNNPLTEWQEQIHPLSQQQQPTHPPSKQQELIRLLPERPGQQLGLQQTVSQPTGVSHIRVRPASSFKERLQNYLDLQHDHSLQHQTPQSETGEGTKRTIVPNVSPQHELNTHVGIGGTQPDILSRSSEDPNVGSSEAHSGFDGSAGSGLQHSVSNCGPYGASIHHGIMRGKHIS